MNKNIQWLKREIHKELESWHGVEGGIDGDGINEIMLLINQLDEPEVKQLYEEISELESYNDELIRDNNQLRNEIDNQEVLSQEWIDFYSTIPENIIEFAKDDDRFVPVEELQNLLVPKQEEVDQAYKDGYEKGKEHATEKQSEETETVARVLVDYLIASAKLKLALSMEVEELEE